MKVISKPTKVRAAGDVEKFIYEYIGSLSGEEAISVARMESPAGWSEPGQCADFQEITLVTSGALRVETRDAVETVPVGAAVVVEAGEWVRYSTPGSPAEYVAICRPAFRPERVNRDESE